MNFNITYVDELAAEEHRQELEEQARVERLLNEAREARPAPNRFSLIWWLLHLRHQDRPEDDIRRN